MVTLSAMELRSAVIEDAPKLVELRNGLAEWMLNRGIEQWQPDQFDVEHLTAWIEAGLIFIYPKGDQIAASVAVLENDPLIWGPDDGDAGYIHMLMVDRRWSGRGLGHRTLEWAERHIERKGKERVRLDVTAANATLQQWYTERGYEIVDTREFDHPGWNEVVLLEKSLSGRTTSS